MDPATDTTSAEAPPPRTLGQELAAERERQGLSRAEVAQRLHMSQWQIEALEGSDYGRLPKGTFLRGFVRNYAKTLGLDGEALLARLAEAAPRSPAPGIVVPSQNIRFDPIGERLSNPYVKASGLAVAFVALGFAVLYWWFYIRPSPPASTAKKDTGPVPHNLAAAPMPPADPVAPSSAPVMPMPTAPAEPAKANVEAPKVAAAKPEPAKPEPAKPEPPKKAEGAKPEPPKKAESAKAEAAKVEPPKVPPAAQPGTPQDSFKTVSAQQRGSDRTLKLRFRGESWVEIRDRNGRVLLSRLNPKGTEAEVSGRPPFNVVIGNAPDVQMLYDDREFPLEPHTRVAVARFTVE